MRVAVTGATGRIGSNLVAALKERGDDVTVLSRRPDDAKRMLGVGAITQRWTARSKEQIQSSRVVGTALLVEGLRRVEPRPRVLVFASAVGYYGARGDERLDERRP